MLDGASGLNAWYGAAQILFDVGLEVGRGEVVALMGRNGAGKSTTLKAIMGLLAQARAAASTSCGHDISRCQPYRIARLGLGYVPEDRRIFTDLTVMENLEVGRQPPRSRRQPAPAWTPEQLFALFPNLGEMPRPARRPHERRRAADADRRAHADGQPATWCCSTSRRKAWRR